jgi:hypothetical protein
MDDSILGPGALTEWSLCETMRILTLPGLTLAVINKLDEVSIMEIALLNFLCKPILVTNKAIAEFEVVSRTVDYIDTDCNFMSENNNFISWYRRVYGASDKRC